MLFNWCILVFEKLDGHGHIFEPTCRRLHALSKSTNCTPEVNTPSEVLCVATDLTVEFTA